MNLSMSLEENISHCFREYPKMKDRIEDLESLVDELAMLIRMLVHSIRKTNPDNETARKAVDYLQRHDLQGLILRSDPPTHAALRDEVERLKDENRRIELLEAELVLLQDAGEQGRHAGAEAALRWAYDAAMAGCSFKDWLQRGLRAITGSEEGE